MCIRDSIDYLDRYCGHDADLEKTSQLYSELSELKIQLKNALQSADERKDRLELLNFQANEIDAANPKVGEDIILENEYKRMSHIEDILKTLRSLQGQINSDDQSIVDMLSHNHRLVESLVQYDENLKVISDLLQSGIGYGYHVIHKKSKNVESKKMDSAAMKAAAKVGKCTIHYGGKTGKGKRIDMEFQSAYYSFKLNIRDTQGKDGYPTRMMCDFKSIK